MCAKVSNIIINKALKFLKCKVCAFYMVPAITDITLNAVLINFTAFEAGYT